MSSGGHPCIDRSGGWWFDPNTGGRTMFTKNSPINVAGTINRFCVYVFDNPGTPYDIKLKIFRQNGTNIDYIAQSATFQFNGNGLFTFDIDSISVQAGDYVGVWAYDGGLDVDYDGVLNGYYIDGDITSNTAESSWTSAASVRLSLSATLTSAGDVIYVKLTGNDANSGATWALAKLTINAGINALNAGGDLHIGFGDYSAQAAISLNKTMSLLCETADTGGGTGTVVLPVTA